MGQERTVIHCNRNLKHQIDIAHALQSGFRIHGKPVSISDRNDTKADLHICLGPWFAYNQWRTHNTLYIDRAYWGDPDHISVHWLVKGEKLFTLHNPERHHPELRPVKSGDGTIYLCDYGDKGVSGIDVRRHPAEVKPSESLEETLNRYEIAIGKRTTALVDAAILGLRVKTDDPFSPVYRLSQGDSREDWIRDLAWHNWSLKEIECGDMWNVLGRDK